MGTTFRDVEQHLEQSCDGFFLRDYTISMVSDLVKEMDHWETDLPFVEGMRSLGVFEFDKGEQLCFVLLCDHIFHDGLKPIDYGRYHKNQDYKLVQKGKEGLLNRGIIRRTGNISDNELIISNDESRHEKEEAAKPFFVPGGTMS